MHSFFKFIHEQKNFLIPFLLITVFISLGLSKTPIKQVFEYDFDEGTALMKSQLYLQGFSLYNEIWDDQPPLLTVILSYCLKLFGQSAYHARILILFFSAMLLWTLYLIIMSLNGSLCAFITVIFLALSAGYLRLSLSVMPAIPSLLFAMLSIYYVILYKKHYLSRLLLLSGVFMAISLQIKLITAFLILIILLEIMPAEKLNSHGLKKENRLINPIIFWLAGFTTVYITITIIFFRFNFELFYQQILQPHLKRLIVGHNDFSVISRRIFIDYDIAILALISVIIFIKHLPLHNIAIRFPKWHDVYTALCHKPEKNPSYLPVIWLILISFILFMHRPIWHHYYLLIATPLCWLAAISLSEFIHANTHKTIFRQKNIFHWLTACLLILTILRLPAKYHKMLESVQNKTTIGEHKIINLLTAHKNNSRWLATDRPVFAFYSGLLVPPELALISSKRTQAENFTQEYLSTILTKYKPEQILFIRFPDYENKILPFIEKDYIKIYQGKLDNPIGAQRGKDIKLYLRKPH